MPISGITSQPVPFTRPALERPSPAHAGNAGSASPQQAERVAARHASAAAKAAPEALTSAPPEGVDPSLWSVLTTEERAYFAKVRALGPLTYGPTNASASPQVRGGRVDVTV